jgi:glycosyltransferase involved in cell wall biosynthesis
LARLYSGTRAIVYPSLYEGFGLAPLEANACGTYVVGIAEGRVRENITEGVNGTLIRGYQMDEFTNVIKRFIGFLNYAGLKGREARDFVLTYWNKK